MAMKLRVRAVRGGGGALRVEVRDLDDLQTVVGGMIGVAPERIRFSLNTRDWVDADSMAPLADHGIRSGDLVYYAVDGAEESDPMQAPAAAAAVSIGALPPAAVASASNPNQAVSDSTRRRELCAAAADRRVRAGETAVADGETPGETIQTIPVDGEAAGEGNFDMDEGEASSSTAALPSGNPIPRLFSTILAQEHGNVKRPQDFLLMAVHSVMLETGLVLLGSPDNRIPWDSVGWLKYTLPDVNLDHGMHVIVRFHVVGDFLVVYGGAAGSQQFHRLSLSASKFLKGGGGEEDLLSVYRDTLGLWKEVKDNLTLRLLKLLCEIAGLPHPACFQLLPSELKMKVLEMVAAEEVAALACVCSELRFLASDEELWKGKYMREFKVRGSPSSWKEAYVQEWYSRRRRQRAQQSALSRRDGVVPHHFRRPPLGPPWGIIGGDYDLYPNFPGFGGGGMNPFGGNPRFRRPLNPGSVGPLSSGIGSSLFLGSSDPDDEHSLLRLPGQNP